MSRRQGVQLALASSSTIASSLIFLTILLWPGHYPSTDHMPFGGMLLSGIGYCLVVSLETVRMIQSFVLTFFAWNMRDPVPMVPQSGLRVAVLTTIVPDKEPIELVAKTLRAMRALEYEGLVDVWILDEGDDPEVRHLATSLGVRHFSRKGRSEYNQPCGPFRLRTKAGNHNAWRDSHEDTYDIVAQMDPDHVPSPEFLQRTLGYFCDPDVAFVVAPQVYGNLNESFVTRGAAEQSYVFHGAIQRGANRLSAALLIGTNHLYRVDAWRQIGGYQDSVIEDHLTSMHVHATTNPLTGNHWKGIYTPDVLSIGEGPRSWTDYFNQQYRWAYGVWEILLRHSPNVLRRMSRRRALSYLCLQSYYPSVAFLWWIGPSITALYLVFGLPVMDISVSSWLFGWVPTVLLPFHLFIFLRRFNLVSHERRGIGLDGMLLTLACGPTYAFAALAVVARRRYTYMVTAKADKVSIDNFESFRRNSYWTAAGLLMLVASRALHHHYWALQFWAIYLIVTASLPMFCFVWSAACTRRPRRLRFTTTAGLGLNASMPTPSVAVSIHEHRPVADVPISAVDDLQQVEPGSPAN